MKKQEIEIITLHHLCCAGGTIISKCLAAMPNVVFLSEIHPLNYESFAFDPIGQLLKYDFFSQQQALDFFSNQINDILQVCQQNSKKLIIRDHSYIDFISSQRKYSLLKRVLSKRFKIKTVATLRNPIDCWLGMTERDWHKPVGTFEEYCSRYISFVDEFSDSYIDKYENFVELPDTFIKNICAYCNLEYDPNYKNKIANITLTGDSGRKSNVIVARPRRVYDSQMNQEFCNSKNFKIIQEKVGYNNIDDTDIKSINLALDKPSQQISFSYGGSNLNQLINLLLQFERGLNAILMKINDDISYHPIDEVEVYGEPVATSENLLNSFVNQNQYLDDKIVFHLINLLLPFKRDLNTILMKFNDNISYHPNLALRKPTQQSSYSSHCNQLQSAVNGIKDGKFSFHTELEVNPWWQVDLEGIYLLTEVQVYNRIDACADRVRTLRILLSSDGENWDLVYTNDENNIFGGVDGKPLVVAIASKLARYVRLQLNEENCLHLDEVEVYGEPVATSENLLNSFVNQNQHLDQKNVFHLINLLLQFERDLNTILMKFNDNISYHPNLALRKPTQQSSYSSHCNQLQSAVNGIKDGKFSFHTELEVNPWWQVDLEGIYLLTEVQVYNRIDACADRVRTLRILLSSDGENWNLVYTNDENNIFGGVDGKPLVVAIASKLARYVRLQLNGENCLHLDEVEVYGEPVATSENLLNSFVNQNRHLDQKIVFHASEAGLCNRLRALCSCFCMSKILEIPLEICWEPQAACDCNFDDLYERPTENNVKFISLAELNSIDNPSQVIYINKMKHKNYFYETYLKDKVEQKDFDQEYVRFMRQLKVKPHLVFKINEFTQNFMSHGDILGVHIRRTDHVNYIRNNYPESVFSSDAKFISAIGKEISKGYSKIFLATDNQLTKDMIFQNFPDLVISYCQDFNDNYQQKIDKNNQRHTTVEDALIDLYLLSKCKKIIGSSGSSFSEYAALLGKIPLIYP